MPKTDISLGYHVYMAISVSIVFLQIFPYSAIMTAPHGKQDWCAASRILKLREVSDLLNDVQLAKSML